MPLSNDAKSVLDDTGVDGLVIRQMFDNPRSFNFTDDEVSRIENTKSEKSRIQAFNLTIKIAKQRGFIR